MRPGALTFAHRSLKVCRHRVDTPGIRRDHRADPEADTPGGWIPRHSGSARRDPATGARRGRGGLSRWIVVTGPAGPATDDLGGNAGGTDEANGEGAVVPLTDIAGIVGAAPQPVRRVLPPPSWVAAHAETIGTPLAPITVAPAATTAESFVYEPPAAHEARWLALPLPPPVIEPARWMQPPTFASDPDPEVETDVRPAPGSSGEVAREPRAAPAVEPTTPTETTAPAPQPSPPAPSIESPTPGTGSPASAPTPPAPARSGFGEAVRAAALAGVLLVTGVAVLRGKPEAKVTPTGGYGAVAGEVIATLRQSSEVQSAAGGYVPGAGLVLRVRIAGVDQLHLRDWFAKAMVPISSRLKSVGLPSGESLVLVVEGDGTPAVMEVGRADLGRVDDPNAYAFELATGVDAAAAPVEPTTPTETTAAPATETTNAPNTTKATTATTAASTPTSALVTTTKATVPPSAPASTVAASTTSTTAAAAPPPVGNATETFDASSTNWKPLAGRWRITGGVYKQTDATGYDYISQWLAEPAADYSFAAKLAFDGAVGGGLMINQPKRGSRKLATVIDLTDGGAKLRWGHYDDAGAYVPDGGAPLATPVTVDQTVVLRLEVRSGTVKVFLGDAEIGTFVPFGNAGGIGLVVSQASVIFDDVELVAL